MAWAILGLFIQNRHLPRENQLYLLLLGTPDDFSYDQEKDKIWMLFWLKQLSPTGLVQQFILSLEADNKCQLDSLALLTNSCAHDFGHDWQGWEQEEEIHLV